MRLPVLAAVAGIACAPAVCQTGPPADPATQIHKQWELGNRTTGDLAKKDGSITDARILPYLQQLVDRLTNSAGAAPLRVQLTRSFDQYAAILPNRALLLSAGMLGRIEDEAELSGLIAHELAHLTLRIQGLASDGICVLDPGAPSSLQDAREIERQATVLAISTLKAAGYDPTNVLALFTKLAYEHPAWGKAISSDDLQDLRARLETEPAPATAYRIDSSAFVQAHSVILSMLPKAKIVSVLPKAKRD